jgi:DNA polymerase I
VSDCFSSVVVCDFEYETSGGDYDLVAGDLPKVLCMVACVLDENLQHMHTVRLWRGEFGSKPPFDTGPDTLFVAYSAWAEMTCFITLEWKFPEHIFDQHTAYLAASNVLPPYDPDVVRKKIHKRLSDACRAYDIRGWEQIDKAQLAKDIGEGRWRDHGQAVVYDYCEEDVRNSVRLLRAQLKGGYGFQSANVALVLHWSNYSAKAIALIQARGMLIDMPLWNLVQENKPAVIRHLVQKLDPSHGTGSPIYTEDGEWSYAAFEGWLELMGVRAWPRTITGQLSTDGKTFRQMHHVPGVEELSALKDATNLINKSDLPIGRDGRNRPGLFPFGTATGRNAHRKSLYNCHAGLRSFMVAPPGKILVYLDWKAQEVAEAAALSGDAALAADYQKDIYWALARLGGLTDDDDHVRWARECPEQRQRMKPLQLGVNYGMTVPSLARGLDRHPVVASDIVEKHRRKYARFWAWRENVVQQAMLTRRIETVFGWPLHLSTSPNRRTLYNFPMQGNGAEMLRVAAWRLCEIGLVPSMLIHDGILIELDHTDQIEQVKDIMRWAGREVCGGFEVGVSIDQELTSGEHYCDKRPVAKKMWGVIMQALREVGAVP